MQSTGARCIPYSSVSMSARYERGEVDADWHGRRRLPYYHRTEDIFECEIGPCPNLLTLEGIKPSTANSDGARPRLLGDDYCTCREAPPTLWNTRSTWLRVISSGTAKPPRAMKNLTSSFVRQRPTQLRNHPINVAEIPFVFADIRIPRPWDCSKACTHVSSVIGHRATQERTLRNNLVHPYP